jgi:hypothetical protein
MQQQNTVQSYNTAPMRVCTNNLFSSLKISTDISFDLFILSFY